MRMFPRLTCLAAAALALSACKSEKKSAEAGTAQGEILPGSASDAMLPLDSVRSQAPLAPPEAAHGGTAKSGSAKGASEGAAEASDSAAPAPAPSISVEPAPTQ